jgi:hypothetical protein
MTGLIRAIDILLIATSFLFAGFVIFGGGGVLDELVILVRFLPFIQNDFRTPIDRSHVYLYYSWNDKICVRLPWFSPSHSGT